MGGQFTSPCCYGLTISFSKARKRPQDRTPGKQCRQGTPGCVSLSEVWRPPRAGVLVSSFLGLPWGLFPPSSAQLWPLAQSWVSHSSSPTVCYVAFAFDSPEPGPQAVTVFISKSWRFFSCHLQQQVVAVFIIIRL